QDDSLHEDSYRSIGRNIWAVARSARRLCRAMSAARLNPRILQRNRAVEDRMPRAVIEQISDEITVALELHPLFGRCRNERRLDLRRDDALGLGIEVVEIVPFGTVDRQILIAGHDGDMRKLRGFATRAQRIAGARKGNGEQS